MAKDSTSYSVYEAKAKLSELLRHVKKQRRVVITERGEPVAHVVPPRQTTGLAARLKDLKERGIIQGDGRAPSEMTRLSVRPGALQRFLRERE